LNGKKDKKRRRRRRGPTREDMKQNTKSLHPDTCENLFYLTVLVSFAMRSTYAVHREKVLSFVRVQVPIVMAPT
jgi:hypothetical protein